MTQRIRTNLNLSNNQIMNVVAEKLASDPSSPSEGQFWFNTTVDRLKYFDGTAIITIHPSATTSTADTLVLRDSSGNITTNEVAASTITIANAPTGNNDAVRKIDLEAIIQNINHKGTVVAATTAPLSGTWVYNNSAQTLTYSGTLNNPNLEFDGIVPSVGESVLVKNETTALRNGIYTLTNSTPSSYTLTRSINMNSDSEIKGAIVHVIRGATQTGTGWFISDPGPFVLGTTAIIWSEFNYLNDITTNGALVRSGNTVSLNTSTDFNQTGNTLNLSTTGVTAGIYSQVTVDSRGRVTAGSSSSFDLGGSLANPFASWPVQPFLVIDPINNFTTSTITIPQGTAIVMNDGKLLTLTSNLTATIANGNAGVAGGMGSSYTPLTGLTATYIRRAFSLIVGQGASGTTMIISRLNKTSASQTVIDELPAGYKTRWARLPVQIIGALNNASFFIDPFTYRYGWTDFGAAVGMNGIAPYQFNGYYSLYQVTQQTATTTNTNVTMDLHCKSVELGAYQDDAAGFPSGQLVILSLPKASTSAALSLGVLEGNNLQQSSRLVTTRTGLGSDTVTIRLFTSGASSNVNNNVAILGMEYGNTPTFTL